MSSHFIFCRITTVMAQRRRYHSRQFTPPFINLRLLLIVRHPSRYLRHRSRKSPLRSAPSRYDVIESVAGSHHLPLNCLQCLCICMLIHIGATVKSPNNLAVVRVLVCTRTSFTSSDLVYPNSSVSINMCSDCETCGLLNHCK